VANYPTVFPAENLTQYHETLRLLRAEESLFLQALVVAGFGKNGFFENAVV
jgi:hypothetical protein